MKSDEVLKSLKRHAGYLQASIQAEIVAGLKADGLVSDGAPVHAVADRTGMTQIMTPIQASSAQPRFADAIQKTFNQIRHATNFKFVQAYDEPVDTMKLDAAFREAGTPLDTRVRLKHELWVSGLIPA